MTGGFVPAAQVRPEDDLEEGEVPFPAGLPVRKKSTHSNFLRRDRKRKQVAGFIAQAAVNAKETAKLLAAEKKKSAASHASSPTRGGT